MSNASTEPNRYDREYRAAICTCARILDAAAEKEHVPPDEFRAAIREAITQAQTSRYGKDPSAEAFLLSLVAELF